MLNAKIHFTSLFKVVKTGRIWYSGKMTHFRIRRLISLSSGRQELCNIEFIGKMFKVVKIFVKVYKISRA